MSFSATKCEWSELYVLLRILADGYAIDGRADLSPGGRGRLPVARVTRAEHDGQRDYTIDGGEVHITGQDIDIRIARTRLAEAADRLLAALTDTAGEEAESPGGIEELLDEMSVYDLAANTNDRTDITVTFHCPSMPGRGFIIRSRLAPMRPLLDGGRAANIKYEVTGAKLSGPAINKVNSSCDPADIKGRIAMLAGMGCSLRFADVADKIFRHNLTMIDLRFPRLAAAMVMAMTLDDVTRLDRLTAMLEADNPLKIKDDLVTVNGYYRHKVREFLLAATTALRPTKPYDGRQSAVRGLLLADTDGTVHCFSDDDRDTFTDFLMTHTRLERGPVARDKYGMVERENGIPYMKLNLKVGITPR